MARKFPQEAVLRDGKRVIIRPFTEGDIDGLFQFFRGLPEATRRLAWDNIDNRAIVETWGHNIDYSKVVPLLAVDGSRVVADSSLHYREGGPLRLVGRVKWLLEPDYRGLGLGTILVNAFIDIARGQGLRHLTCMLADKFEADAIATLRGLGFEEYPIPAYGADPDGDSMDMVKLVMRL